MENEVENSRSAISISEALVGKLEGELKAAQESNEAKSRSYESELRKISSEIETFQEQLSEQKILYDTAVSRLDQYSSQVMSISDALDNGEDIEINEVDASTSELVRLKQSVMSRLRDESRMRLSQAEQIDNLAAANDAQSAKVFHLQYLHF